MERITLDLGSHKGFTAEVKFYDIHVECQRINMIDVNKHLKRMARQRCVGASGNSTG